MPITEVTSEELKNLNNEGFALLQFYATWCGPCKMLKSEIDKMMKEDTSLKLFRYDIEQDVELAKDFGARGVPALFILKDNEMIGPQIGFMPKSTIENWIHSQLEWEAK